MLKPRLIVCLDVAGDRVVKGRRFENLVDMGRPEDLAVWYEDQGADEVVLLDITASVERRGPNLGAITRVARALSIPLAVGGGISSSEGAGQVLGAGADKVSVNSAALDRPELISETAARYGGQAVVVAIDVRRDGDGFRVYRAGGRDAVPWMLGPWVAHAQAQGAGELLITSIDRDGTGLGYDLAALSEASRASTLPIIASGGGSDAGHLRAALQVPGVTGVLVAGALHRGEVTVAGLKADLAREGVAMRVAP